MHNCKFFWRNCVLIILFQIYESKAGLFDGSLFWVSQYDPYPHLLTTFILEEQELIQYQYTILMQPFMIILKVTKKQRCKLFRQYIFLKYMLRVKVWICLNETSILVFTKLAIFHSI